MRKRLEKGFQHYGLVLLKNPGVLFQRPRYIFVLSHMRSFSTLLTHILGSHPQISGYAEMWLRYNSGFDLLKLQLRVASSLDYRLEGSFVLDKILHNKLAVAPGLLARGDISWIYLFRRPEPTLRSIMHLWKASRQSAHQSFEDAGQYYTQRLQQLEMYHAQSRNRVLIEGEALIAEPASTLQRLAEFLELSSPLLPEYRSFRFSGKHGFGDSSEVLRTGRIVRQRDDHREFVVPEELGILCQQAYDHFVSSVKA